MRTCPKCEKEFKLMYQLYQHCKTHHEEVQFNFEMAKVGSKTIPWPVSIKDVG